MIYDGGEDTTTKSYSITLDQYGNVLTPGDYLFTVVAKNWVRESEMSDPLTVSLPYLVSNTNTEISGAGIDSMLAAVDATIVVQAVDDSGASLNDGGS